MSGRDRGAGGAGRPHGAAGRGGSRAGDERDGLESPLLRASEDSEEDAAESSGEARAGAGGTRTRVIVEDEDDDDDPHDPRSSRIPRGPDASTRGGLSHREAALRLRRFGPNEPPPARDDRLTRVVSRATWRSPAALATWIAIACELSRALAHYRSDARDDAAAASSPDDQQSDALSRFRYGADREPTWVALLGLLAVQALNALCAWAAETRVHKHAAWMRNVLHLERTVRVIRDGEPRRVSTREVVPGDVVRVRVGDVVPADVRIIPGDGTIPGVILVGVPTLGTVGHARWFAWTRGAAGGEGSIVVLAAGDAVAAGSTIVSGEATCVVTATGANIHWVDDDVTRRHGASQGATNEGNPLTRSDPSSSSSMDAGVSESSFVVNVSAAFVCVTLCAVLYAWDSYVDVDGAPTDGGFFGAAALAAALFATAASVSHDSVVNGPTHMAIRTLARRGTAVTRRVFAVHALAEMDAVLVDERVVRTAGTCGVGSSSEGGLELRAVHVTQTGVSPKDVLVAAALSSRWFEAPVDAVDGMILDAVDVAPLSDSYTLNEHALTGGDGGSPRVDRRVSAGSNGGRREHLPNLPRLRRRRRRDVRRRVGRPRRGDAQGGGVRGGGGCGAWR